MIQVRTHLREIPIAAAMCACGQPAWCRSTINRRPWTVVRALPWDTENLRADVGLRQATPHSEVLLRSSSQARHQRPGRVHLAGWEDEDAADAFPLGPALWLPAPLAGRVALGAV